VYRVCIYTACASIASCILASSLAMSNRASLSWCLELASSSQSTSRSAAQALPSGPCFELVWVGKSACHCYSCNKLSPTSFQGALRGDTHNEVNDLPIHNTNIARTETLTNSPNPPIHTSSETAGCNGPRDLQGGPSNTKSHQRTHPYQSRMVLAAPSLRQGTLQTV
jgi:hypothetical protein